MQLTCQHLFMAVIRGPRMKPQQYRSHTQLLDGCKHIFRIVRPRSKRDSETVKWDRRTMQVGP